MAKKATAAAGISATEAPMTSAKTSTTKTKAASPTREAKARAIKSAATESATTKSAATKSATTKAKAAASPTTPANKAAGAKGADKKAAVLLTLTDIGDHLATTFDMPKSHAKIYLAEAVTLIAKNLRKGHKVRISGLGVFEVKKRAARKGRNPSNGEPIKIKATKRVGFAVARDLKVKL